MFLANEFIYTHFKVYACAHLHAWPGLLVIEAFPTYEANENNREKTSEDFMKLHWTLERLTERVDQL